MEHDTKLLMQNAYQLCSSTQCYPETNHLDPSSKQQPYPMAVLELELSALQDR